MGESSELFVNCLEAMVETCLPADDADAPASKPCNLSSSLSSLTLGSPTDKGKIDKLPIPRHDNNFWYFLHVQNQWSAMTILVEVLTHYVVRLAQKHVQQNIE